MVVGPEGRSQATSELAPRASPAWPPSSPGYFRDIQNRLKKFVESGQLGLHERLLGQPGLPALPPEANLMAVAHYLEALGFPEGNRQDPHHLRWQEPPPNWLVGGVPCAINLEGAGAVGAVNMERLNLVSSSSTAASSSSTGAVPDLVAIASFYKDWTYGGGLSSASACCRTATSRTANDYSAKNLLLPAAPSSTATSPKVHEVDLRDPEQVQERFVAHTGTNYADETKGLHPWDGVTEPNFEA